jgi:hypothetical protein
MIPANGDNTTLAEAFQHYWLWYAADAQPFPEGQDKEVTDAWWADAFRRRSEALSSFKAALECGELTVKVFDVQRNMPFAITPAEWRDHRPFAGFLSCRRAWPVNEASGDLAPPRSSWKPQKLRYAPATRTESRRANFLTRRSPRKFSKTWRPTVGRLFRRAL